MPYLQPIHHLEPAADLTVGTLRSTYLDNQGHMHISSHSAMRLVGLSTRLSNPALCDPATSPASHAKRACRSASTQSHRTGPQALGSTWRLRSNCGALRPRRDARRGRTYAAAPRSRRHKLAAEALLRARVAALRADRGGVEAGRAHAAASPSSSTNLQ